MARLIGVPESWLDIWAFRTAGWLACGLGPGSNPTDCVATWPATTLSLKRRLPTLLACTLSRRSTRRSSVSMKRALSKHSTDLDPVLPLSPGRAERHGFEYFRHGTLSLYAALDTRTGDVIGKTTDRHTSVEFVDFLEDLVASQPAGREIHIVADNLSSHKTKSVLAFPQHLIRQFGSITRRPIRVMAQSGRNLVF